MELAEDETDGVDYLRSAADLGLYIMTHGFRTVFLPDDIRLYRASEIKGGINPSHPGRYVLVDQKLNPHKMYPISNAEPIQGRVQTDSFFTDISTFNQNCRSLNKIFNFI